MPDEFAKQVDELFVTRFVGKLLKECSKEEGRVLNQTLPHYLLCYFTHFIKWIQIKLKLGFDLYIKIEVLL